MNHKLLNSIKPVNIKKYLLGKGWQEIVGFSRKDIWIFNDSENKNQLLIPSDNDYELYTYDLFQVVTKLQQIEQRNIESIVTQLQRPDVDILRYRIQSPQIASGSIPLSGVSKFIGSVINFLKASFSDCTSPNLHHTRMGNRVNQLLEKAQFGQPEHGSFIVKIIFPVLQDGESLLFDNVQENDLRKSVVHLLKNTNKIIQAVKSENAEQFVRENQEQPSVSDNFINALIEMQLSDDASIDITSEWSPILKPNENIPSFVKINAEYFENIAAIGCRLSPKPENRNTEQFTGFVTQLDGNPNESGKPEGNVTIYVSTPDQDSFSVLVSLDEKNYNTALRAHENTISVNFSGKMIWGGAPCRQIIEVKNFSLSQNIN
jgi:hypothetical protein